MPQTTTPPTLLPLGETHPRTYRPYRRIPGVGDPCSRVHDRPLPPMAGDTGGAYGVSLEDVGPLCWPCARREAPAHVLAMVRAMCEIDRALTVAPPGWQLAVLAATYRAVDAVAAEHGIGPA